MPCYVILCPDDVLNIHESAWQAVCFTVFPFVALHSVVLSMPTGNTRRGVCLEIRHRRECVVTSWNMAHSYTGHLSRLPPLYSRYGGVTVTLGTFRASHPCIHAMVGLQLHGAPFATTSPTSPVVHLLYSVSRPIEYTRSPLTLPRRRLWPIF